MANVLEEVSVLTDVSENTLKKFIPTIDYCISHMIYEGICEKRDIIEIDLEIGQLDVKICLDGIHYRFLPSKELEKLIVQAVKTKTSPVLAKLEKNLQDKIDRAYKELL